MICKTYSRIVSLRCFLEIYVINSPFLTFQPVDSYDNVHVFFIYNPTAKYLNSLII